MSMAVFQYTLIYEKLGGEPDLACGLQFAHA